MSFDDSMLDYVEKPPNDGDWWFFAPFVLLVLGILAFLASR